MATENLSISQKSTSRRSSIGGANSQDNNQNTQKVETDIQKILKKLEEISSNLSNPTNSARNDKCIDQFTSFADRLDQVHQITAANSAKIDTLPNLTQFKDATANICKSVDVRLKEISSALNRDNNESITFDNHLLDWTMRNESLSLDCSGRPSIVVKQSIDDNIMDVLKNSEEATWKSIDSLRDLIVDQKDLLISIQKDLSTNTNGQIDTNPSEPAFPAKSIDGLVQAIENQQTTLMEIKSKIETVATTNRTRSAFSGNPSVTKDSKKEAMTQNKTKPNSNVPETLKKSQKRLSPASLDGRLESEPHFPVSPSCIIDLDESNWSEVRSKRRSSNISNGSQHRNSFPKPRSIFWSKLDKTMNIRKATDYIIGNGLADISEFSITCLTKNDSASYMSYKIDTTTNAGDKILAHRQWPANSFVRNFNSVRNKRQHADLAKRNRNFI